MAFDAHANFGVSSVAVAPSPATTGTSLTVATGEGTRFPAVPFNATLAPAGILATPANAEIVRVTARSGDVLTITRAQEGSVARAVVVGDLCVASITAKALQDIETTPFARTDLANTFTASQTLQLANPILALFDTGAAANARNVFFQNTGQQLRLIATDDAYGNQVLCFSVDRLGNSYAGQNLYEKSRGTPLGHWIAVPFNPSNFFPNSGGTWTVAAGNVVINRYTRLGNTLLWSLQLQDTTVAGATDQFLNIRLPIYPSGGVTASGITRLATAADATGALNEAYVLTGGVTNIINVVCGRIPTGPVALAFSMALETQ